jgi:hypothetical protein
MSKPRPIHHPSRPIQTQPHESEPMHSSYEDASPMLHDEEDDFHLKLQRTRRESSGGLSFWRTSDDRPAFSSVNVKTSQQQQQPPQPPQPPPQQQQQQPETSSSSRPKKSLLGGQLQSQNSDHSVSTRQGFTICLVVLGCFVRSSPIPLLLTHTHPRSLALIILA